MENKNKSAFTIAELILTTVIMAIICVVAPIVVLKRDVKPQIAKKFDNIAECTSKCIFDSHNSTLILSDGKSEQKFDYNKNTNEFYTIILVGGGAGGSERSIGYPGETKTILLPTLDENSDITGNNKNKSKYEGILTGYYLLQVGDGGKVGKNGNDTIFCAISIESAKKINSASCFNKDSVIIASAKGGIISNEGYNITNSEKLSNIKLKNNDKYGNGGDKKSEGTGGLVIIK